MDLGKELTAITVWNDDNTHKSMLTLAVNSNNERVTEDFTIINSDDKVYTLSNNFTLVETPEEDLTIDIVYTPYFDLLFFPSFYINTLYADKGVDCLPRITKSPANMYFDETEMTIKPTKDDGTINFYLDSFENLNRYTLTLIDFIKRYTTTVPWDAVKLSKSFFFNSFLPCFDEQQYNTILNNLVASAYNVNIITSKDEINNNRQNLYTFYIKNNKDNKFIYENDGTLSISQSRTIGLPLVLQYLLVDKNGELLITITEDMESQLENLINKLSKVFAIMCLSSGLRERTNDVEFVTSSCFIGKALKQIDNNYQFINDYYLPKVAVTPIFERNIQTTQSIYDTDIVNNHIALDTTVDTDKTETSNYYIAIPSANYIIDGTTVPNQGYSLPVTTLPFYPFYDPIFM